jgi:uncharacterized coiled-coil DUF342 family protein
MNIDPILIEVGGYILGALLAINVYFVRSLVVKIDQSSKIGTTLLERISNTIKSVDSHSVDIKSLYKEIDKCRARLHELEGALKTVEMYLKEIIKKDI